MTNFWIETEPIKYEYLIKTLKELYSSVSEYSKITMSDSQETVHLKP